MDKEGSLENRKTGIWLSKDGIVRVNMKKELDYEFVDHLITEGRKIVKSFSGKPKILVDITDGLIPLSSKFRKDIADAVKELVEDPGFKKVAVFGGVIPRTVASFIISASGEKNIKVFNTEEEALEWLKK